MRRQCVMEHQFVPVAREEQEIEGYQAAFAVKLHPNLFSMKEMLQRHGVTLIGSFL